MLRLLLSVDSQIKKPYTFAHRLLSTTTNGNNKNMNITLLQENLLKALTQTGRIISAKAQLPIVQNVLLVAEKGRLRASSTNLETTETVWVGAKIEKEGGLCVSSRTITELALSLPQEAVHLVVKEGSLLVHCAGFNATIPGIEATEFPPLPTVSKKTATSFPKDLLAGALTKVLFSAATDEGRPLLTGVKIVGKGGELLFVATDGYRLSLKRITLELKDPVDIVVPARALLELMKVSQEEKSALGVSFVCSDEGQASFVCGDTEIHTRLIDGEYPGYEKILPTTHTTRALLDKERLVRAAKSAAVFAKDNANIVRFHIENQTITVSANAPSVGENSVEVEAKIDGEGGDIAFNSRFLLEFLNNYSEDELLFEMTGSLNPGVFKPVKDESYLHIIMPVRVAPG